jgi:hypothetical protein
VLAGAANNAAMRILIIAPHHPTLPNVANEAAAASNAHPGSTLLAGVVVERDIAKATEIGGFDLVWLATHGDGEQVLLSGSTLPADGLITYIAASGARTVYLNTCNSVAIAQRLVDETPASVIATIGDIDDGTAMRTGILFAGQLAALQDPRQAYERSKPARNHSYVYLQNARQTPPAPAPASKPKAPRKRGGQPGNSNAVTHGFYSRHFTEPEAADLAAILADGIDDEIALMRVHMRRVMALASGEENLDTATHLLDTLGTASTRLATLLRTKRLLTPAQGNDVAKAIGDALTAVVKEMQLC